MGIRWCRKEFIESTKLKQQRKYHKTDLLHWMTTKQGRILSKCRCCSMGGEDNAHLHMVKYLLHLNQKCRLSIWDRENPVKNNLNKLNMLTVRPEIVDADI